MIQLTRLSGQQFYLNSDLIETIEETPDTVILLTTGEKYVVSNPAFEIVQMIKSYHQDLRRKIDEPRSNQSGVGEAWI